MQKKFEIIIQDEQTKLTRFKQRHNIVGYLKMMLLILFAISIYWWVKRPDLLPCKIGAALLFLMQVFLWIYHNYLGDVIAHSNGIVEICQRNIDRINGKWTMFKDVGEEFADAEHHYCCDLDIVGEKSLFQYMNVTHTWHGRKAFADDILHAHYDGQKIKKRQLAIKELSDDISFQSELEYRFSQIGCDSTATTLVEELKDNKPFMSNKIIRLFLECFSLAIFLFGVLTVTFRWQQFNRIVICLYAAQTLIWLLGAPFVNKYLGKINRLPFKLNAYNNVISFIAKSSFKSEQLCKIQEDLSKSDFSAVRAIKELAKISDRTEVRSNSIIYIILNILFLWDLRCAFQFEDWKSKYFAYCEKWFLALGEIESLSCFSVLINTCDNICFPVMRQKHGLEVKELAHPLLSNKGRVSNSLKLNNDVIIISGSNMSGKSTFLRTVGINIVLARAGSVVCAKEMFFSDMHVVTSMRLVDSLNEGISTFYAELIRIKKILKISQDNSNTLFLIDEIFRGTNSVDRLSGARTVISKLSQSEVSGMITTHDLELCELESSLPNVKNYNFSEYYEGGKIIFNYKMQQGKSTKTNAKYLMEMIGIRSD